MSKFYATYGWEGHPYRGGWTEIIAPDEDTARAIFRFVHPNRDGSMLLNCCSVYDEQRFTATGMLEKGNFGSFCHETITFTVEEGNSVGK